MPPRSLFGLNLLAQFVLFLVLGGIAWQLPDGLSDLASLAASFLIVLFLFGLLYGFFRLLGIRSSGLEGFYQRFPMGMFSEGGEALASATAGKPSEENSSGDVSLHFEWKRLCSFRTLRFAGALLIITAIFSLLFNIDWTLLQKILVCAVVGAGALGAAEWAHRGGKRQAASLLSLLSFMLLQAALTLLALYAVEQGWPPLLQSSHVWLAAKFLFTCAFLFTMFRYPSDLESPLYFTIAYASPMMLLWNGFPVQFPVGLVFLVLMSALALPLGRKQGQPLLWPIASAFSNAYIYLLFTQELSQGRNPVPVTILALIAYALFFLMHLILASSRAVRSAGSSQLDLVHAIAIHVFAVLGIVALQGSAWFIDDYLGFFFLAVALMTFCAYMATHQRVRDHRWNELLLNLSIIISAAGLFVQTQGQWSAVVFLLYSCGILWYSLHVASIRTRIYGFLILGVSLVKLYFQFTEIFESIPGSLAILVIGILLVALSYKFEAVKDVMLHGLHRQD